MADPSASARSVYESVRLPLGKTTCIRVIKLRPSITHDYSDPIICDFSVLDVDNGVLVDKSEAQQSFNSDTGARPQDAERVQYQALSYTWGEPPANQLIKLNGTTFCVRDNLMDFLCRARADGRTGYLWIDAICIDQETVRERNHQVGMMGDIYTKAQSVIVWLGSCSDLERNDLEGFLNIFKRFENEPGLKLSEHFVSVASRFLHLPYWNRAWIVQEYHLARQKVIWYGELQLTQRIMENIEDYLQLKHFYNSPAYKLWRARDIPDAVYAERNTSNYRTLFRLLAISKDLECADNRDRIFALLPLLPLSSDERNRIVIRPDYSKSTASLFAEVAQPLIHRTGNLKFSTSWTDLITLDNALAPDFQDTSVQETYLDARALFPGLHRPLYLNDVNHHCQATFQRKPSLGIDGCSYCLQKPFLTFGERSIPVEGRKYFSRREWEAYIRALLASEDENTNRLGIKYCFDREVARTFHLREMEEAMKMFFFNKSDFCNRTWQLYVQALLASKNTEDVGLGFEYWATTLFAKPSHRTPSQGDTRFMRSLQSWEHDEFIMRVQDMLKSFSKIHLSHGRDQGLSVRLVESRLTKVLDIRGDHGVFASRSNPCLLPLSLLWRRSLDSDPLVRSRNTSRLGVPSWSWALYESPIDYFALTVSSFEWPLVEAIWPASSSRNEQPYLSAAVRSLDLSAAKPFEADIIFDYTDLEQEKEIMAVGLGVQKGGAAPEETRHYILVVISREVRGEDDWRGPGLWNGRACYERVGAGYVSGRCLVGQPESCLLV